MKQILLAAGLALASFSLAAETLTLEQAVARALASDPRIEERQHLAEAAQALVAEVEGRGDWFIDGDFRIALTTVAEGDIFVDDACTPGNCELRDDRYSIDGLTPWFYVKVGVIKPLYTFGKLENYAEAAKAYVDVKRGDTRVQQAATVLDVKKAYYGYLAARDSRLLLGDVAKRLQGAIDLVQHWLDEGEGDVSQSELYALQSGKALVAKYKAQASAMERIALDGLKVVTGVGLSQPLSVADRRLRPVPLPGTELAQLQGQALEMRPEMAQLEAGLKARRSLLLARKAEIKPNVYAGLAGVLSYSPGRDRLENPFIYDPFNDAGITPVVGMQWKWAGAVQDAKTAAAEANLNAVIAKSSLAQQGIPYQVAEQYHQVQGYYESVQALETAARSARRWMVASFTDFEAGLGQADKMLVAFQGYVMAASDYLKTTFEYNMHVARLDNAVGVAPERAKAVP